jgi:hypothetical protein
MESSLASPFFLSLFDTEGQDAGDVRGAV